MTSLPLMFQLNQAATPAPMPFASGSRKQSGAIARNAEVFQIFAGKSQPRTTNRSGLSASPLLPVAIHVGVEDERTGKHDGLVKEIANHTAGSAVVPPSMHQEKLPEIGKLADGVVGGVHGLNASQAFLVWAAQKRRGNDLIG